MIHMFGFVGVSEAMHSDGSLMCSFDVFFLGLFTALPVHDCTVFRLLLQIGPKNLESFLMLMVDNFKS